MFSVRVSDGCRFRVSTPGVSTGPVRDTGPSLPDTATTPGAPYRSLLPSLRHSPPDSDPHHRTLPSSDRSPSSLLSPLLPETTVSQRQKSREVRRRHTGVTAGPLLLFGSGWYTIGLLPRSRDSVGVGSRRPRENGVIGPWIWSCRPTFCQGGLCRYRGWFPFLGSVW